MIEWIDNTACIRKLIYDIYKKRMIYVSMRELRAKAEGMSVRDQFTKIYLPSHPAVLGQVLFSICRSSRNYLECRKLYSDSTSTMSFLGYMIGYPKRLIFDRLGDRHGENIMLDLESGRSVHVDFNCLFDKVCT